MCEVCITSSSGGFRLGGSRAKRAFFSFVFQGRKSFLASAAGASAAAAAAAAAAATVLRIAGWSCSVFFFNSNSSAKAIWLVDVVQNTQKSNVYEYETKTCM